MKQFLNNFKLIKNLIFLSLLSFLFISLAINSVQAATSDAIAIRVVPNSKHLSPYDWYQSKNFSGSPQSIIIDGYEAVRDGRTVYVNAANISGNELYTNIYIISYNQDVEQATVDIFGKIIINWKFNINVDFSGNCINASGSSGLGCVLDKDCAEGDYCDSEKSKIIRDVKRLSDLGNIDGLLTTYNEEEGFYPKMQAGSYLPQITISTWPSWLNFFAKELGGDIPIDPLNKIGDCGDSRFNKTTCWDEEQKEFAGTHTPASNYSSKPDLALLASSSVYMYRASSDGTSFDLCAEMETTYSNISGCNLVGSGTVSATAVNNPPEFTAYYFPIIHSGEEYRGYLEAVDPDGDTLTWTLNTTAWATWSATPDLLYSSVTRQRTIYAESSGDPAKYDFSVTVDDGRGGSATGNYYINVLSTSPVITPPTIATCPTEVVTTAYYTCTINATPAATIDMFHVSNLPDGLTYAQVGGVVTISGNPTKASEGSYLIEIAATSDTGVRSASVSYTLEVQSYCGDGLTQKPNSKGTLGKNSDGMEDCDLSDNLAISPSDSSVAKQYWCDSSCVFTGGYCGDGNEDLTYGEFCDDGKNGNDYDACYDDCTITTCGDGIVQSTTNGEGILEACDGSNLNGATCGINFSPNVYGTVSCDSNCALVDVSCCIPENGGWSTYMVGTCTPLNDGTTGGTRIKTRTCTNPTPSCNGNICSGLAMEIEICTP